MVEHLARSRPHRHFHSEGPQLSAANLDSTALRYFRAAAESRSIWRAAGELSISASSLSRQIANLEQHLDVLLFERLLRGLKLTSAGEILLYHVERSLQEVTRAFEQIDALKGCAVATSRSSP
jgi:DNA-binding transcriptional LysR family regulator